MKRFGKSNTAPAPNRLFHLTLNCVRVNHLEYWKSIKIEKIESGIDSFFAVGNCAYHFGSFSANCPLVEIKIPYLAQIELRHRFVQNSSNFS